MSVSMHVLNYRNDLAPIRVQIGITAKCGLTYKVEIMNRPSPLVKPHILLALFCPYTGYNYFPVQRVPNTRMYTGVQA